VVSTAITLQLWLGPTIARSFLGVLSAERVFGALQVVDLVATAPITLCR
jgi:hypothetical protein